MFSRTAKISVASPKIPDTWLIFIQLRAEGLSQNWVPWWAQLFFKISFNKLAINFPTFTLQHTQIQQTTTQSIVQQFDTVLW